VIRVVRSRHLSLPDPTGEEGRTEGPEWFMDYWNADGSAAQMCGNGVRVFVAYLLRRGWIDLPAGGEVAIGTRSGVKVVRREGAEFSADLGRWRIVGGSAAVAAGGDVKVAVPGLPVLPGLSVDLGNPHVVVVLPDVATLTALDLTVPPVIDPAPPEGANVEFVVPLHDHQADLGHLRMRVHERGSGETRSCGTGAVAAAVSARAWGGERAPGRWRIDVPGGTLHIEAEGTVTEGDHARLIGPAAIVAEGVLLD
jgi:diaminopimelate epimerase